MESCSSRRVAGALSRPKLLCDGMLGKLAHWLRLMGVDTAYMDVREDEALLRKCEEEGRALITADKFLHRRATHRGIRSLLLKHAPLHEQIAEVCAAFGIVPEINPEKSRCPVCNSEIREASKEEVSSLVDPLTLRLYDKFWVCVRCGKVYWVGSHWRRMQRMISRVRETLKRMTKDNKANP